MLMNADGGDQAGRQHERANQNMVGPGANQVDPSNFRPISNLSTISKVLERLALRGSTIRPHLLSFPNFSSHQSGFRTHSTETALLEMLNNVHGRR